MCLAGNRGIQWQRQLSRKEGFIARMRLAMATGFCMEILDCLAHSWNAREFLLGPLGRFYVVAEVPF